MAERFEILALVGSGGMGKVYKARNVGTEQIVALKVLVTGDSDVQHLQRLKQEAAVLGEVQHPSIVHVHAVSFGSDHSFIAMEYLEGQTLAEHVLEHGPLTIEEFRTVFECVGEALKFAHSKGIVHRDIKPSNIMLIRGVDGSLKAKLMDFGISKLLWGGGQVHTRTGEIIGTPSFMSPEQFVTASVDNRSDIYSLGCVLYYALAGVPPFDADSPVEMASKHMAEDVPLLKEPDKILLNPLIARATSKEKESRYEDMDEFLEALRCGETRKIEKSRVMAKYNRPRPKTSNLYACVGISVVVLAMAFFAYKLFQPQGPTYRIGPQYPELLSLKEYARKALVDGVVPTDSEEQLFEQIINRAKLKVSSGTLNVHTGELMQFNIYVEGTETLGLAHEARGDHEGCDRLFNRALDYSWAHNRICESVVHDFAFVLCSRGEKSKAIEMLKVQSKLARDLSIRFEHFRDFDTRVPAIDSALEEVQNTGTLEKRLMIFDRFKGDSAMQHKYSFFPNIFKPKFLSK